MSRASSNLSKIVLCGLYSLDKVKYRVEHFLNKLTSLPSCLRGLARRCTELQSRDLLPSIVCTKHTRYLLLLRTQNKRVMRKVNNLLICKAMQPPNQSDAICKVVVTEMWMTFMIPPLHKQKVRSFIVFLNEKKVQLSTSFAG